jgi:hypothetical protein
VDAAGFEHPQNRCSGGQFRGPDHRGRNCFMKDPGLNPPDVTPLPDSHGELQVGRSPKVASNYRCKFARGQVPAVESKRL